MNKIIQTLSSSASVPIFQDIPDGYSEKMFNHLKSTYQSFPEISFDSLSSDEKEMIYINPIGTLPKEMAEKLGLFQSINDPLWLNIKWHANCYLVYAEYYFEAWVTKTSDGNGPRVPVENLEIKWRHGDVRGIERGNNIDMIAKEDRVYAYGLACGQENICLHGLLNHFGATAFIASPNGCVYA